MSQATRKRLLPAVWMLLCLTAPAAAQYQQMTPGAEEVGVKPTPTYPEPRSEAMRIVDVLAYAGAIALAGWIILKKRSRRWLLVLMLASLGYFGFYRNGCVCPIGAIQNVALSLTEPTYTISIVVTLIFLLPIVAALFFGRIFCGGVCPFGVVQDMLARVKLRVPLWIDKPLRLLPWVYLATVIYVAVGGVILPGGWDLRVGPNFLLCRYDPFVGLFRAVNLRAAFAGDFDRVFAVTGTSPMWLLTGGLLLTAVFIGRPYCRWICPYGAILGACSRTARRTVTVMPEACCDCELCDDACPYGAIAHHASQPHACLACARCYAACPLERSRLGLPAAAAPVIEKAPAPAFSPPPRRTPVAARLIVGEDEQLDLSYLPALVERCGAGEEAALPLLQQIQARHRYLPRPALERACELTGLSMAHLLGVSTFYNQFRLAPIGEHLVCVCHGTACHVAGAERISDAIRRHLAIDDDVDTDAERRFTIQPVACLGCCSLAPCMQIDGVTYGHLTGDSVRTIIDDVAAGKIGADAAAPLAGGGVCACGVTAVGREEPS